MANVRLQIVLGANPAWDSDRSIRALGPNHYAYFTLPMYDFGTGYFVASPYLNGFLPDPGLHHTVKKIDLEP